MDTTDRESALLSKLQSSNDLIGIYNLFAEYLHPFKTYLEPKRPSSKPLDSATTRSLAKQFLPFLNKSLSLLPRRLASEAESQAADKISHEIVLELFSIYRLCISCLDLISSQLSCKPYTVQVQRVRFVHCLEGWKLYEEAEVEGLLVLESLRGINFGKLGAKAGKLKSQLLPRLNKESRDKDFALVIVETVTTLVKCALMNQSKEEANYKRILALVDEAAPWFKILDASEHEKFQRMLVSYLNKISLFLVMEIASFSKDLVLQFFELSFSECGKSSVKDQIYKFALRVCSCIFSQISLSTIDILQCIMSSVAAVCKVEVENTVVQFLELVCYCVNKCRTTTSTVCCAVAELLNRLADSQAMLPLAPIVRLYATGLLIVSFNGQLQKSESTTEMHTKDSSGSQVFLDYERLVQKIPSSLNSLKDFFATGSKVNGLSEKGMSYFPFYYKALEFLCEPLAGFVYAKRTEILGERDGTSFISCLFIAQEAFHEFGCIHYHSIAEKQNLLKKNGPDECPKTIILIAVAGLILSLRTECYIKESANLLNDLISNDGVPVNGLKYLFAWLYNVAIVLYRNKKVNEASKALKLSCKASWNRLVYHCKSNELCGDTMDDASNFAKAAKDIITESCEKTVFLLDLLYEGSRHEMTEILKDSLEKWSIAENIAKSLPPPYLLVKHWVKIGHKLLQDGHVDQRVSTLYSLLSSSVNMSRRTMGMLLEQELMAHKAMNSLNSRVCQKKRMEIMDALLEKVYVSSDNYAHKSRILIAKGRELRAFGVERLEECIWHLSEAISTLGDVCSGNANCDSQAHHLMASALCLRALCSHESVQPNPKVLLLQRNFEDIQNAINLWLCSYECPTGAQSTTMIESVLELLHDNDQSEIMVKDMLRLVYHVLDFLSIKGYTEIHLQMFEILIRLCKWRKLPLEEVLTMLWESRRLGHALCASPIHESFISKLSEFYGEISSCSRFWMNCMKLSKPLLFGFKQNFLSSLVAPLQGSSFHGSRCERTDDSVKFVGSDPVWLVSVEDVKLVASDIISNVPFSGTSAFLSAYLYHDLSDQLILKGRVIQALGSAKESHRLRSKLFQETFRCSVDQGNECDGESANETKKHNYAIGSLHIHNQVACEAWGSGLPGDFKCAILSPWIVLQGYLESTLQVGTIQEMLGNGTEAETLLSWGKTIALYQCLPLYVISFSFLLGKLYRRKKLWELAEEELKAALQILDENREMISCLKCRKFLEISIYQQLGDLFRNRSAESMGNPSTEILSRAGEMYISALHRVDLSEWKNSISTSEEAISYPADKSYVFNCKMDQLISVEIPSEIERPNVKAKPKRCRRTKKDDGPSTNVLRMTRSRSRASQNNAGTISGSAEPGSTINSKNGHLDSETYAIKRKGNMCGSNSLLADCACEVTRLCNKMKCWHCLALQVIRSLSLDGLVHMKWELIWRRLLMMLLIGLGKCFIVLNESHRAHQILLMSTSVLLNPFCPKYSSPSHNSLIDLIGKDMFVDVLPIEQAALLYNVCRIALESYGCKFTREHSCQFSCIGIPMIVSWLKHSFMLCSEVPLLFQKVSRLLTILHVLSTSVKAFSLSLETALSESHWAAFFHQASIGNNLNQLLFSCLMQKEKCKDARDVQGTQLSTSDFLPSTIHHSLRVTKSLDLDEFVIRFYQRLPCSTVICISMFGGSDANLLSALLCHPAQGWILLSRLNSGNQPVLILLPVDSVLDESSVGMAISNTGNCYKGKDLVKPWHCPWFSSVVDEAAPIFKVILKENYISSSTYPEEDTKENRILWWSQRERLDHCLGKFLQGLEESWLGPWKYFLLGHLSDNDCLSSMERKLVSDLRLECKITVSKDLLRDVLSGAMHASEIREHGLQLILNKGCFIGGSCMELTNSTSEVKSLSLDLFQIIPEGDHAFGDIELTRNPVILVVDSDVQMLPWESIPILRNEEVYRMPSVTSIYVTRERCCHQQELLSRGAEVFPLIDPLDSFYLLNPGGDLTRTQVEFEHWFRDQNFEGKTGTAPTVEELVGALKYHDLFIYFGHGSGAQYIPRHEIEKLEGCAATLLMGCSSGCLSINGHYAPEGAPLSYLLAGSPVIVANLWEVTDKDIDRFGKAVLDAWLRERSNSTRCSECDMLLDKFESIRISENKGNGKGKRLRNKSVSSSSDFNVCLNCCNHRPKVGFFMGQARKACNLPFLIGAAPVCYGVPTGITKKKVL